LDIIRKIKGTQDILPDQSFRWQALEKQVRSGMAQYNFKEVRTPVFELTRLFSRGIGELTDIVSKEMYTFVDRSKKSLTLKPEMTAPVIRAYIENNLQAKTAVNKLYYISSLFRQENPQAGRLRQFHQFGAELIGAASPLADVEIIDLALNILENLDLKNCSLKINSVGDPESREPYKKLLQGYLLKNISAPSPEVARRIEHNPLRVLDSKDPGLGDIIAAAPKLADHLSPKAKEHYATVKNVLGKLGIGFEEDPTLVRGLDYYTHTVFEITSGDLGAQNALLGGGRYDLLTGQLAGKDAPAVGFAAGMERILMALESQDVKIADPAAMDIFLIALGGPAVARVAGFSHMLRRAGFSCDTDYLGRSMKAQFREANRQKARWVLILGEDELTGERFTVKNMATGEQTDVPFNNITNYLKSQQK